MHLKANNKQSNKQRDGFLERKHQTTAIKNRSHFLRICRTKTIHWCFLILTEIVFYILIPLSTKKNNDLKKI